MDITTAEGWGAAIYMWIIPMVVGDAIFPPIPSEMLVITGGALAAEGRANLWLVGLMAAVASWLGDIIVFQLFKRRLGHILDRGPGAAGSIRAYTGPSPGPGAPPRTAIIGARFIPGGGLLRRPLPESPRFPPAASVSALGSAAGCGPRGKPVWATLRARRRSFRSGRAH